MALRFFLGSILTLFVIVASAQRPEGSLSWEQVKKSGKGTVVAYWYESRPFIYKTSSGQMEGIEYEILEGFIKFLHDVHHVDLRIDWREAKNFGDTYTTIRNTNQNGIIGVSAFSITPERKKEVDFSSPYMADISVLITSKDVPIVQTTDEFNKVFSGLTAITIRQTTYEQDLLKLKRDGNLPFRIEYIPSHQNILQTIARREQAFGFIDLPVYMMIFSDNPSVNVKRQNMFPMKREGYAFIYPRGSDWSTPIADHFSSEHFKDGLEKIIGRYIDIELYRFIENLPVQSETVMLLTKEKEIQYNDLMGKLKQIEEEARTRNILIALVLISFAFLMIIVVLYRKQTQQKIKIERQRESIEKKNLQLEKRNQHLVALDEEKNNLIKILAHDLRTPINHVHGLAQVFLLTNASLTDDQKMIIREITDASTRLNKMITNILDIDAVENNRAKIFMDDVVITPLVHQVVKSFDKPAMKKGIVLSFSSAAENAIIKGDPLFLLQIVENLLSNAIKFSSNGKDIAVYLLEVDGRVQVRVQDAGPGLTAEDQQSLFKKFQRLSAKPTAGESSTGLGLSIVKKYVELMNGHVWCESEPRKGATFIVEFPKASAAGIGP